MRSAVLCCTALFSALPYASYGWEAVPKPTSGVTLIFRSSDPIRPETVETITGEVSTLLEGTGALIDGRLLTSVRPNEQFANLIVVDLKGPCYVDARQNERLQPGALAFTHRTDGELLPFVEVLCNQIRAAIRPVMTGDHFRKADKVFARAVARVLAHELYHILGRTCGHGGRGIAQDALSGRELIDEDLKFDREDLDRIHNELGGLP